MTLDYKPEGGNPAHGIDLACRVIHASDEGVANSTGAATLAVEWADWLAANG